MQSSRKTDMLQMVRFGLVGGIATFTHLIVATGLLFVAPSAPLIAINIVAFVVAFGVSFIGHSRYTFKAKGSLPKFLIAALAGLAANNLVLVGLMALRAPDLPSLWAATLAAPLVVYAISKTWAFSHAQP